MRRHLSRRQFVKSAGTLSATLVAGRLAPPAAHAAEPRPRSGAVRFGVQTPPQHTTYRSIADTWKAIDDLGYDSAFVFDHFFPIFSEPAGPCFEGWTLLAALAAQTRRLRVGVLVTGNTYRFPSVLAKMAATVDHASDGRLVLGLGAGWFEHEHEALGIPFYSVGERAQRLVEAVQVIKLLFTQERSTFNGKYYRLKEAVFQPRCVQTPHPPILIGGMGPKVIQPLAARYADIWHFFVREGGTEEVKQVVGNFDKICRRVGRDPAQVTKSTSLRPPQLAGSPEEVRGRVQALVDAGVRYLILSLPAPYDHDVLRRFAGEVMPAFREA
jgi:F420-dependent oxidoreductase-like protein